MSERRRTYESWRNMRSRCLDPKNSFYHRYGGRGIAVCERWTDFKVFLSDMGHRPVGLTLDRIDNSKGYSPDNCKWSTPEEQAINRRSTHYLTLNGKTQTIRHWEREIGLSRGAINQRLKRGWDVSKVLMVSVRQSPLIKIAAQRRARGADL